MSDDENHSPADDVFNLEHLVRGFLPEDARWKPFSEDLLAEAIRTTGSGSVLLNMALVAALTSDKAAYRLRLAENTRSHPGGVPKLETIFKKAEVAKAIQVFVDQEVSNGTKKEAAIAAAQERFDMGRSSIFKNVKIGRMLSEV